MTVKEELFRIGYQINDFFVYHGTKDLKSNDYETFINAINSVQRAGAVALCRWDYVADKVNYWQNPMESFERKNRGDCEDQAVENTEGLLLNDIDTEILVTWGTESGHAICHPVGSKQTVCTAGGRLNHGTTYVPDIAKYWYDEPLGVMTYSMNPKTYEIKVKKNYTVKTGSTGLSTNKELKELPYFVKKMSHIDPEFKDIVLNSLKKANKNEEFEYLKGRLKKLKV